MSNGYNKPIFTSGTVVYKDFDISFKSHPTTGDLRSKTNEEAIKQSLKNLIFTNLGERPFRRDLYGGINSLLFEPMNQVTQLILVDRLTALISNWEPRVEIIAIDVPEQDFDRGSISISIKYNVLNIVGLQTLDLILHRVR